MRRVLFADRRISVAVARGSGKAVAQLGAVAGQHGLAASVHGAGGAWMISGEHAYPQWFDAVVEHSMDRKVCSTLNVCCIIRSRARELVSIFVSAMTRASQGWGTSALLYAGAESQALFDVDPQNITVVQLNRADLATEWEWENDPECPLVVVGSWQ